MKSELAEKLMKICSPDTDLSNDYNPDKIFGIDNLTEEQRLQVEAELIKHFQFSRIVWMDLPSGLTEESKPIVAQSIIIHDTDNPKYTDLIGYIYKVLFTPKIYGPIELYSPVKDGCVFAPTVYNPETFEPKKSITLTWCPEFPQDINAPVRTYEDDKQMIRDMLEKVLDNPEDYKPEGFRRCMIRYAI